MDKEQILDRLISIFSVFIIDKKLVQGYRVFLDKLLAITSLADLVGHSIAGGRY